MTKRIVLFGAVVACVCAVMVLRATASNSGPVFAALEPGWSQVANSKGYGQIKPSTIYDGGLSGICSIHWTSWGGRLAIGTGIGLNVNPATYKTFPARMVITLSDLSSWHGRRAYRRYTFGLASPTGAHAQPDLNRCAVQKHLYTH